MGKRQRSQEGEERRRKKKNTRERNKEYKSRKKQRIRERVSYLRNDSEYKAKELENKRLKYKSERSESNTIIEEYQRAIREGPEHVCTSCNGLFFRSSTKYLPNNLFESLSISPEQQMSTKTKLFCITCANSIKTGIIPRLCTRDGLELDEIDQVLRCLTPLEERLVSPVISFLQMRALGHSDRQFGIRGQVVNVPIDVPDIVNQLPRTFERSKIIQVKLKRMISMKHDYIHEYIHPQKVFEAAKYLSKQPLFKENNIEIDLGWMDNIETNAKFIVNPEDNTVFEVTDEVTEGEINERVIDNNEYEENSEVEEVEEEEEPNPVETETMIQENGLILAPGENRRPISFYSENCEYLAFPKLYGGKTFNANNPKNLSISDLAKYKLRYKDRRFADNPTSIFWLFRHKQIETLRRSINFCLKKTTYKPLTAGDILDPNSKILNELVRNDQAYAILADDRTSPVYWEKKMKNLMAMIRQLGVPTFFFTLSAAEPRWAPLLVLLHRISKGEDISEDEAIKLSSKERYDLLRRDPVTCAQYFDHRFRALFKLLKNKSGPFAPYKVIDFFIRVEFQHRGSPHVHCLLWLEGAPKLDNVPSKIVENFVDQFISSSDQQLSGKDKELLKLQTHRHTDSCTRKLRNNSKVCRFSIPFYPMRETKILEPFLESEDENESMDSNFSKDTIEIIDYKQLHKQIRKKLHEIESFVSSNSEDFNDYTFDRFLSDLSLNFQKEVTDEMYLMAIRFHIKRRTIFIKRHPKDVCINGFNPKVLSLFRANMDIQYIVDPYGCVHYVVNYISKSFRGVSKLIRDTIKDVNNGYDDPIKRLRKIGHNFLNGSEVSAQEAVYVLLSIPLTMCSRQTIFINTGEKEKRTVLLKPLAKLKDLNPESTDVYSAAFLEYYSNRPETLNDMCLADFASKYERIFSKKVEEIEEDDDNEELIKNKRIAIKNKENKLICTLYERKIPKIIRYRRYQHNKEPMNYFREKLMLYVHWRDEEKDILNQDIEKLFIENKRFIIEKENYYINDNTIDYDSIIDKIENPEPDENEDEEDKTEDTPEDYRILDTQRPESTLDIDIPSIKRDNETIKSVSFRAPQLQTSEEYNDLIRKLNDGQRTYLFGLQNLVESNQLPLYHLITGGAGVGKSVLIKAIHQTLIRYYAKDPKLAKVEEQTVLLTAPTGLAAFHINGLTLHTAFALTVTQKSEDGSMKQLSGDRLNIYRNKLFNLKFIIIDECSMVGKRTLRKIDNRLKQIMGSEDLFGGVSILYFGDFNQLHPVSDSHIFRPLGSLNPNKMDLKVLAGNVLWEPVRIYRLTEIMRQKEDLLFANALNNLANFQLTEEDKTLFKDRIFSEDNSRPERRFNQLPKSCIHLFPGNREVDEHNDRIISQTRDTNKFSRADDLMSPKLSEPLRKILETVMENSKRQDTHGLMTNLELKIGVRYMIITNIDVNDGLVNGSSGVLRKIDCDKKDVPMILWLDLENENIGVSARAKYHSSDQELTPIIRIRTDIIREIKKRNFTVIRSQFPLVPSEAITIHKSQGQTYEEVVVHLGPGMDINSYYTALSRAKKSSGLYLIGNFKPSEKPSPSNKLVIDEIRRLTEEKPVFIDNFDIPEDKTSIFYQNYPSLHKNIPNIICDKNVTKMDFLIFVETKSNDNRIDGYNLLHQIKCDTNIFQSRPFGIAIYGKEGIETTFITEDTLLSRKGDSHLELIICQHKETRLIVIYASPGYPKESTIKNVLEFIRSKDYIKSIIIGDFNININGNEGEKLEKRLLEKDFSLKVDKNQNSTPHSQIDLIFANFDIHAKYYSTSTTYHRPITAFF